MGLAQRIDLLLKEDGGAFILLEDVREALSPTTKEPPSGIELFLLNFRQKKGGEINPLLLILL
jgi:hypothetical protein